MQPSPLLFFKSIWIAAVWQKDVRKKKKDCARWQTLFHPYLLGFWHSCLAASASQLCFPSRKEWDLDLSSLSQLPFLTVLGLFSVRSNYTWICSGAADHPGWLGAWAGSQNRSDGTKGTVLIYTHWGSVSGALLSGMSFHFCTLHWQTLFLLRNQTKLLKIPQTTSKSP